MVLVFSAEKVTGFSISGLSYVCESGTDGEKGEGEKRVVLCTCVGCFKKKKNHNLFCSCRLYNTYPEDTQSKDSCRAGQEGEHFFKLLNFKAYQPAFNQFGACHGGTYVVFWLLNQQFILQTIKYLLQM